MFATAFRITRRTQLVRISGAPGLVMMFECARVRKKMLWRPAVSSLMFLIVVPALLLLILLP